MSANQPVKLTKLRSDAETRLKEGSAPPTNGWSVGVNALSLLHKLASTPETAVDALKLLHELQVHQVELDIQHEQIESSQREMLEDLARYQGLFECAPVAYLILNPQRNVLECNHAAASLFGITQEELRGRSVDSFLTPPSRPVLLNALAHLRSNSARESCEIQLSDALGSRSIRALVSGTPGGRSFLLVLVDGPERK